MKRVILVAILWIASISPCALHAQGEYYPLEPSNRWIYRVDSFGIPSDTEVVAVAGDSLFANGRRYFRLNLPDVNWEMYVRADSEYVYYPGAAADSETAMFHLRGIAGETTYVTRGPFFSVTLAAIYNVEMFGVSSRVLQFHLDGLQVREVAFSDKFGPLSGNDYSDPPAEWPYVSHHLIGCTIGGIDYGLVLQAGDEEGRPGALQLLQNYPNPFNPATSFSYRLDKRTRVRLEIFNLAGNLVASIVDRVEEGGTHTARWNAARQPSGVYFCRLSAGGWVQTKRLLLMR